MSEMLDFSVPKELMGEWSELDEEPDFDFIIRSRRAKDEHGAACSQWQFAYAVEGTPHADLSQRQRDYAAAMLRLVGGVVQDAGMNLKASDDEFLARIATQLRAQLKATWTTYGRLVEVLVFKRGLRGAASILGLPEFKIRHLLKGQGRWHGPESVPTRRLQEVFPPSEPNDG